MDMKSMIGQRLAFGFTGTELTGEFTELIREYKIGNVILFRGNIQSSEQLRSLCSDLQDLIMDATGFPAFITIDQEGGMVSRMPPDLVSVPGNMAVAATGDPQTAYQMACISARQLRGTGPNFNLAPVLDVNNNPSNPVIGVRSFGDDPNRTAEFGKEAVRGYNDWGVLCCGKHFPGHGDTDVDSHLGLPLIDKSLVELWQTELIPFRAAIDAGIPAIMSSHILFPQIEPDGIPATMSRRIMHDLLREKMGFSGLILSDAMEMDAIRVHYGTERGCVEAMKAGVDIVFVCSDISMQRKCAESLLTAAEAGTFSDSEMKDSFSRIITAKEKYAFTQAEPGLAGRHEDFISTRKTAVHAAVLYSGNHHEFAEDTFFCGPKDYRLTNAANAEAYGSDFVLHMKKRFGAPGLVISIDPTDTEIRTVTAEAQKHRQIVLGTCRGHLFRGQIELAKSLAALGKPMTVIALRDPYDLGDIPDGPVKLAVFDYTLDSLYAAEIFLRDGIADGKMPVRM